MSTENEKTVTELFKAWTRLDFAAAADLLTDSFVFRADPAAKPITGKEAVRAEWEGYLKFMKSYDFKILQIVSAGTVVMMERVEWIGTRKVKTIELPITGVFELSDGKIGAWGDYWDPRMAAPPAAPAASQ
jgi:limonene-1,2-epoxide hydrolase